MSYRVFTNKKTLVSPRRRSPRAKKSPHIKNIVHTEKVGNVTDPAVWGSSYWFFLHVSAAHVPEIIPNQYISVYWQFVESLPYLLPCGACATHASEFISLHRARSREICSSRENYFNFFVDFHNAVNTRQHKPTMTYKEAWAKYTGNVRFQSASIV